MTTKRNNIFPILVTFFLIVPIIEIYLLIQVGGIIGVLPTIGLVVLTAVLGAALLRAQGLQTYMRFNQALSEGRVPASEILEGVALLIGGALLLTPGFFTDAIGFICLLPFSRKTLIQSLVKRYNPLANMQTGASYTHHAPGKGPAGGTSGSNGNIYEGEITSQQPKDPP